MPEPPVIVPCPRCQVPRTLSPAAARKVQRRPKTLCQACARRQNAKALMYSSANREEHRNA